MLIKSLCDFSFESLPLPIRTVNVHFSRRKRCLLYQLCFLHLCKTLFSRWIASLSWIGRSRNVFLFVLSSRCPWDSFVACTGASFFVCGLEIPLRTCFGFMSQWRYRSCKSSLDPRALLSARVPSLLRGAYPSPFVRTCSDATTSRLILESLAFLATTILFWRPLNFGDWFSRRRKSFFRFDGLCISIWTI